MDTDYATPVWLKAILDLPPDKLWAFYEELFKAFEGK